MRESIVSESERVRGSVRRRGDSSEIESESVKESG